MPTWPIFNTSHQIDTSACSVSVRGIPEPCGAAAGADAGAGSAERLILPLDVSGNFSSGMKLAGTIYDGKRSSKNFRSTGTAITFGSPAGTMAPGAGPVGVIVNRPLAEGRMAYT